MKRYPTTHASLLAFGAGAAILLVGSAARPDQLDCPHAIYFAEDWENGQGDWYADAGIWEVGVPTDAEAHGGHACAGTNIDGNYPSGPDSRFISPVIVLPAASALRDGVLWLRFWHLWSYQDGDWGEIQISRRTGGTWGAWESVGNGFAGESAVWVPHLIDITSYAGETIRLGLYHEENGYWQATGWFLDDLAILDGAFAWSLPETFEANVGGTPNWGGWYPEQGIWEIGVPTAGPGAMPGGRMCAGTVLTGEYPNGNSSRFISPETTLPADPIGGQLWLSIMHWYDLHDADYAVVQICVDGVWTDLSPSWWGYSGGWTESIMDLSGYSGRTVRFGLYLGTGGYWPAAGWYVDDIAVVNGPKVFNNPDDFETGTRGWYASDGVWEVGVPTYGPAAAHSGSVCWGTELDGNYPNGNGSTLITPEIALPGGVSPLRLDFYHWYTFHDSDWGRVWVYPRGGEPEVISDTFSSTSDGWTHYYIDLASWAGQVVAFGFELGVAGYWESAGWYIDDVKLVGLPQSEPMSPYFVTTVYSPDPPVINWTWVDYDPTYTCIYASRRADAYLPNLGNRIAMFDPSGYSFTDIAHPGWEFFYQVGLLDGLMHECHTVASGPPHVAVDDGTDPGQAVGASLAGSCPNPFNPTTVISFRLDGQARATLEVFDATGRRVSCLVDAVLPPGNHAASFDADTLPSGVYFSRLTVDGRHETGKMMLVR